MWLFNAMQTGVELLMVETFNATETPKYLGDHGVTCAGAGTVFWLAYLNAQRQLPAGEKLMPTVRIFNGGGAPKPKTLHYEMLAELGAPVIGGWGLTESPINTMVHVDDADHKKAETDGRACPDVYFELSLTVATAMRAKKGNCASRVHRCAWDTWMHLLMLTHSTRMAGFAQGISE